MSTQLSQIAKKAKLDRKARFTSLAHLLTPELVKETWGKMNRRAASGVDEQSAEQFGSELETQVEAICAQLKEGTYHRVSGLQACLWGGPSGAICSDSYPQR